MKRRWLCSFLTAVMLLNILAGLPLRTSAVDSMHSSQAMIDILKKMEGFYAYPYWDNSQWTVGYGTRCPSDKLEEYRANGIPEPEAEALLRSMLLGFENEVKNFAKKYQLTFNQHEFDALVSLTYNCGGSWARDTNGILSMAIRSGAAGTDLIYAMSLYSKAHVDYTLIQRRLSESAMYLEGIYEAYNDRKDGTYPETYHYVFLDGNGGEVNYAIHGYDGADPQEVRTSFSRIPTGVDEAGNPFVYTFAGWYTASEGGTKVEVLDGSLPNATVLYAQWADPTGQIVTLPKGDVVDNLLVTNSNDVNIRSGPGTFYAKIGTLKKGSSVTITQVYMYNSKLFGKYEEGWIQLSYTNYEEVLAQKDNTWPKDGVVTGDNVNVRNNPGTTGTEIQYKLNKGAEVVISQMHDDGTLTWGQLQDGNWICLDYVKFKEAEAAPEPTVQGAVLLQGPDRTEYVQMQDFLRLEGSVLQLTMSDGTLRAMTLTHAMIKTYSNAALGETTVIAIQDGYAVTFPVTIIMATVTFVNEDGTVLSQGQYPYGESIIPPEVPAKPNEGDTEYVFAGWDKKVTACHGNATYTAVFQVKETEPPTTEPLPPETTLPSDPVDPTDPIEPPTDPTDPPTEPTDPPTEPTDPPTEPTEPPEWPKDGVVSGDGVHVRPGPGIAAGDPLYKMDIHTPVKIYEIVYDGSQYWWGKLKDGNWICMRYVALEEEWDDSVTGDIDGNWMVNEDDAAYLLGYLLFPEWYPIEVAADLDGNGVINEDDAAYLLGYLLFPEWYPLNA